MEPCKHEVVKPIRGGRVRCMAKGCGIVMVPTSRPPVALKRAPNFPPASGRWFRTPAGGICIGCPDCKAMVDVRCPPLQVQPDGRIAPSYICPACGGHMMIRLLDLDSPGCRTCGHDEHASPCGCGCAGAGWTPQAVHNGLPDLDAYQPITES